MADLVIDNGGDRAHLGAEVDRVWAAWAGACTGLAVARRSGSAPSAGPAVTRPRYHRRGAPFRGGLPVTARRRPAARPSTAWPRGSRRGDRYQTLLGITGSGKTATIAWTIEQVQRPTLVIEPNKSLAAQLATRCGSSSPTTGSSTSSRTTTTTSPRRTCRRSTPTSRRTRRSTTRSTGCATPPPRRLLLRRDVIVVASVSLHLRPGVARGVPPSGSWRCGRATSATSATSCAGWSTCSTTATTSTSCRGKFRVRGDTIELHPAYEEQAVRIELFGDEMERIRRFDALTGEIGRGARRARRLRRHPLRGRRRDDAAGGRVDRDRAAGAPGRAPGAGQAPRGPAAADADRARPGDAGRGRGVQRDRKLQPPHRRPQRRASRRTRCSTSSPRTSCS